MLCGPRQEGLTSVVYTGYVYERLLHADQPDVRRLLDETDVLVDGPYLPHLYDDTLAWRGSSNQRLLCLSDRYTLDDLADAFSRQKKGFSIQIGPGTISLSGVQTRDAALVGEEIVDNLGESANNGT